MEKKNNDTYFEDIEKIFKRKPESIKQTSQQDIENPDTIMNMINYKKHIDGILAEYQKNGKINTNRENTVNKSIGNNKRTKKIKVMKKVTEITAKAILGLAAVASASAIFLFAEYYVVKPIADRSEFEKDLKSSLEIVTSQTKDNLEFLGLGYTNDEGEFVLNDNDISDYAKLGLVDPKPVEIRSYLEVIEDREEKNDFIKGVYYTNNNLEYTYTDIDQYNRINGFIDPNIGTSSSAVFNNITEAQLVDAYNNGTIYEVVHDLTNTHSKGGK